MSIAVDIPRRRIYVSRALDHEGGTVVYCYIKVFWYANFATLVGMYPYPMEVAISRAEIGPGVFTHTYIREKNGWKIESDWVLRPE